MARSNDKLSSSKPSPWTVSFQPHTVPETGATVSFSFSQMKILSHKSDEAPASSAGL